MTPNEVEGVVRQVLAAEREQATKPDELVLKTVAAILTSFGIDDDDRQEIRLDFEHIRRSRKAYELVSKTTIKTAIGVIITGMFAALWLGIQSLLHK